MEVGGSSLRGPSCRSTSPTLGSERASSQREIAKIHFVLAICSVAAVLQMGYVHELLSTNPHPSGWCSPMSIHRSGLLICLPQQPSAADGPRRTVTLHLGEDSSWPRR